MRNIPNPAKIGVEIKEFDHLYNEVMKYAKSVAVKIGTNQYRFLNSHFFVRARIIFIYQDLKAGKIFTYDAKKDIKPKKLTP